MPLSTPLPSLQRGDWEPHQNIFNLLLQYPDLNLRALAQIFVSTVPLATLWLTYTDPQRIHAVEIVSQTEIPSSVYLPYLYTQALITLGQDTPDVDLSALNVVVMDRMVADFNPLAPYGPSTENASIMMQYVQEREQQAGQYQYPTLYLAPAGNFRIDWNLFRFSKPKQWLYGMGRSEITCFWGEPSAAGDNVAFLLDSDDDPYTTLVGCRFANFSFRSFIPDVIGPTAAANRHKKIIVRSVCTSEVYIDIDVNYCHTGDNMYGAEGGSYVLDYQGKEKMLLVDPTWVADYAVHFKLNPKEPGNQIDCDVFSAENSYFIGTTGSNAEYLLQFDAGLNVKRFKLSGNNIWAGGRGSVRLVESSGGVDLVGFEVDSVAHELCVASTDPCFLMRKNGGGKAFDVHLRKYLPSTGGAGVELSGVRYSSIEGGGYLASSGQSSTRKGLILGTEIQGLKVDGYWIPCLPNASGGRADLVDLGTNVKTFDTGDATPNGSNPSGDAVNQLDSIAIYDKP